MPLRCDWQTACAQIILSVCWTAVDGKVQRLGGTVRGLAPYRGVARTGGTGFLVWKACLYREGKAEPRRVRTDGGGVPSATIAPESTRGPPEDRCLRAGSELLLVQLFLAIPRSEGSCLHPSTAPNLPPAEGQLAHLPCLAGKVLRYLQLQFSSPVCSHLCLSLPCP